MLQELNDLKSHLEHGAELLTSHVPGLLELAAKLEQDPLVQAAVGLLVPETTRTMLANLLKAAEADAVAVAQAAVAAEQQRQAQAAAAQPPADAPPAV